MPFILFTNFNTLCLAWILSLNLRFDVMEEIVSLEKCVPVEIAKLLKIVGYNDRIDTFYLYNPPWEAKAV